MIDVAEIARLRKIVEQATPGPWRSSGSVILHGWPSSAFIWLSDKNGQYDTNDIEYIMAFQPSGVLSLIEAVEKSLAAPKPQASQVEDDLQRLAADLAACGESEYGELTAISQEGGMREALEARLRSTLGAARKYIITHGPVLTNKAAIIDKIDAALAHDGAERPMTTPPRLTDEQLFLIEQKLATERVRYIIKTQVCALELFLALIAEVWELREEVKK